MFSLFHLIIIDNKHYIRSIEEEVGFYSKRSHCKISIASENKLIAIFQAKSFMLSLIPAWALEFMYFRKHVENAIAIYYTTILKGELF